MNDERVTVTAAGRWLKVGAVLAILAGAAAVLLPVIVRSPTQHMLRRAENALADGQYRRAEQMSRDILERTTSARAALIAGAASAKLQESEAALAYFRQVPDDGGGEAVLAIFGAAERNFILGRLDDAERDLRRVLAVDPANVKANERLVQLLQLEGRTWESQPYLFPLIRSGRFTGEHLLMAGSTDATSLSDDQFVAFCLESVPHNSLPKLGGLRALLQQNKRVDAEQLLRDIVATHPEQLEAQAHLGQLLLDQGADDPFRLWHRGLPPAADDHPGIWMVRGLWARAHGQPQAAARCFWEAALRHPNHAGANYQLSQVLHQLGESDLAKLFAERAVNLAALESALTDATQGTDAMQKVAEILESLGRRWEAAAWCALALRVDEDTAWAKSGLRRLRPMLERDGALVPDRTNPARDIDLAEFPLPCWVEDSATSIPTVAPITGGTPIQFVDLAATAGLNFTYFNGADPAAGRAYMIEFNGGGIAVLDYDGDGWPDLYLTQGCPWPPNPVQTRFRDRLFRNQGDGTLADVTDSAGLGDERFSTGATVADFDNDGYPDLYVANIGPNRLYHNNGDGTFWDVTAEAGVAGQQWTSSCLVADLNGDTWPDIYDANYLAGPDVYQHACENQGRPIQCGPTIFSAEPDRLYLSRGDGTFRNATSDSGVDVPNGKGLGVVAADFDNSRRLSLFVSNDTTANFLFWNKTPRRGASPVFRDEALLSGVAFDDQGKAQACMGVAVDDANGDGLLDIFVTNFYGESNNLFLQQPDHSFRDEARRASLFNASFSLLGWGAQFLDADLDGLPDLLVVNGHINDFSDQDTPYAMPPQLFRNLGGGRFDEQPAASLGPYFQRKWLGRALARLDWNRDGREDVVASHVNDPIALLSNETATSGHFLTIFLRGVVSDRDAIGTTVIVSAGGNRHARQLIAGDGFQASNERQLTFGLGPHERVGELEVIWPSGIRQTFRDVAADQRVTLVEGQAMLMRIP